MTARILDGKAIATEMRGEIAVETARLTAAGVVPGLGVLLVGDDPASRSYVTGKEKACAQAGIFSLEKTLPHAADREEILDCVREFNGDERIDGILVQLPLPDRSIEEEVIEAIDPGKDVDGFHPINVGKLILGQPAFLPCTPHGILQLLNRSGVEICGKHVVILGRSNIVGRPLANLLTRKDEMGNATVTLCHTGTPDPGVFTRDADIIIAAAGRINTVTADMVKEGAVIVDVGVNRIEDAGRKSGYRLVGDVDFEEVSRKAGAITPVPGGVGPMTITMLMYNTVQSARDRRYPGGHPTQAVR
jgi:methylenetetrahydrofolate dehydrogenase (NADP+)/methenyltetrahydrofolate cyclohydrolase